MTLLRGQGEWVPVDGEDVQDHRSRRVPGGAAVGAGARLTVVRRCKLETVLKARWFKMFS
jgi:hypothetical protein